MSKTTDRGRIKRDFEHLIASVFPQSEGEWIGRSERDTVQILSRTATTNYDVSGPAVLAGLFGDPRSEQPTDMWYCDFAAAPPADAIVFFDLAATVFNEDLARTTMNDQDQVVWESLLQTQMRRTIARFVSFTPQIAAGWIETMENSLALTYEGKPVRYAATFTKRIDRANPDLVERMVPFANPIEVNRALLEEKWIRAVVDGVRVALLGDEINGGRLLGFYSLSDLPWPDKSEMLSAPHVQWVRFQHALRDGDLGFVSSPAGDLYLMLGSGTMFHKTQGRWNMINCDNLTRQVSRVVDPEVAVSVMRAAMDLSYERKGALFCILDEDVEPSEIVKDHQQADRPNQDLRLVMHGKHINHGWRTQEVITAAAATDGATVLSRSGTVVDIACMIAPSESAFRRRGIIPPVPARGARTTAARQASCFGLVIKVSEDGPISLLRNGRELGWIG